MGHSLAQIPHPLQYLKSISGALSGPIFTEPSGQYSQHVRHLVHFFLFTMGRYVRQVPVVLTPSSGGVEMAVLGRIGDG
jgi:hypothetical protein